MKILLQAYCKVAARLLRRNPLPQNWKKSSQDSAASGNVPATFTIALQKIYNFLQPAGNFAIGSPEKHQNAIKHHRFAKRIIFSVSIATIWYKFIYKTRSCPKFLNTGHL